MDKRSPSFILPFGESKKLAGGGSWRIKRRALYPKSELFCGFLTLCLYLMEGLADLRASYPSRASYHATTTAPNQEKIKTRVGGEAGDRLDDNGNTKG
jgi:hypothetical protein